MIMSFITTLVLLAVLSTISFNTGIVRDDLDESCSVYKHILGNFVDVVVSPLTLPVAEAARWRKLCPADAAGTSSLFDHGFTLRNNGANDEAVDNDNDNEAAADEEEEEEEEEVSFLLRFFCDS